jgi:protocatechuate 3,4-dioxygenase beta subunit
MRKLNLTRRQFINLSAASAGLYGMTGAANLVLADDDKPKGVSALFGEDSKIPYIGITEDGPLYPPGKIPWLKDLTAVGGPDKSAAGDLMYLFGRIFDAKGHPIRNATVEIWQSDNNGNYKHPRAPGQDKLDPNFGYFGKVKTAADGSYLFKSLRPRTYTIFGSPRAPHVHLKMRHMEHGVLTTEMYFAGGKDADIQKTDRVFKSRYKPDRLIITPDAPTKHDELDIEFENDAICCKYDLAFLL